MGIFAGLQRKRELQLIRKSGLFDAHWYLQRNSDVSRSGADPLQHFYDFGAAQGSDPNPLFDSDWYTQQNPEVALLGLNPLVHYLTIGWK
jgi:hypothetical protein